jgi:UDP-glucose 4-epimerase
MTFKNKNLLITGGTGSFGNEVLSQFLESDIAEIRIFSRDEKKQEDMRISFNNKKLKFYLGDVRNYQSIKSALKGVDYVFHAAALKQVPSCEFYPMEAIETNILGAENVINAAIKENVKSAVFLSTDKAVYPINAMGLSKAMMEKLVSAKARDVNVNNTLCTTRYGNVMASRGSVIPLFVSQIQSGKPLTITDPQMTRFMMSLSESVDLVKFAFKEGQSGDIFVKKSPSATVLVLAKALLEIFNAKNEIQYIGTRHSEKLYETLLSREEMQTAEDMGDYFRIPSDNRDLNYAQYFTEGAKNEASHAEYNSHNTKILKVDEMVDLLLTLDFIKKEIEK